MLEKVKQLVLTDKIRLIQGSVQEVLDGGASAGDVLRVMSEAMEEVGVRFLRGVRFVPEMPAAEEA